MARISIALGVLLLVPQGLIGAEILSDSFSAGGGEASGGVYILHDSFDSGFGGAVLTAGTTQLQSGWIPSVNNPPLLGIARGVVAGRIDQSTIITYETLLAQSKAKDVDGHGIEFRVSATTGSLELDGKQIDEVLLRPGQSVRWNPPSSTQATESIVSARLSDGLLMAAEQFFLGLTESIIRPPLILSQPRGGTFRLGEKVELTVGLSGTPPFNFTWRLGDKPVEQQAGATLELPNLLRSQAGSYSVVIENSAGSVTSEKAEIVVYIPPKFDPPQIQPPTSTGGGGGFLLRFGGADGGPPGTSDGSGRPATYVVQWTTDLKTWNDLPPEAFVLRDGKYELIDRGDLSIFRFYRILER